MDDRVAQLEKVYDERYVGFVNAVATVTGSYDTARDAVQEGFARGLAQLHTYRGTGTLAGWVWRIIFRVALDTRRARSGVAESNGSVAVELVDPGRDPDLASAVRALPPRRRLIVFLRYFADFSIAQIADACGISEGTVSASLAQAKASLAHALTTDEVRSD